MFEFRFGVLSISGDYSFIYEGKLNGDLQVKQHRFYFRIKF